MLNQPPQTVVIPIQQQRMFIACAECDNPYPYKCRECMEEAIEKINIASGEDCYGDVS